MLFFQSGSMPPYKVLECATRSAAITLGLFESIGSIEPGKLADLVIYGPEIGLGLLDDLKGSERMKFVVKGGRVWDAETLDEIWPVKRERIRRKHLNID